MLGDKLESTQKTCLELHDAVSQLDQQIEDLTREKTKEPLHNNSSTKPLARNKRNTLYKENIFLISVRTHQI